MNVFLRDLDKLFQALFTAAIPGGARASVVNNF
jgi:hypothetical protein